MERNSYHQSIKQNLDALTRALKLTDKVLYALELHVEELADDIESIEKKTAPEDRNVRFLRILDKKPDGVAKKVIDVLRKYGQNDFVDLLEEKCSPMSDARCKLLDKCSPEIYQFMDVNIQLLGVLVSSGTFDQQDEECIMSIQTNEEKAAAVLNILRRKPYSAFDKFIGALSNTKQPHVVYILTESVKGEPPMSTEHLSLLQKNENKLYKYIIPMNGLLEELISSGTFEEREKDIVNAQELIDNMARTIVSILKRKWDSAYDSFLTALDKSDQKHVTFILTEEGDVRPLPDFYVRLLNEKRSFLIKNLLPCGSTLLGIMASKGVFSSFDRQWIMKGETNTRIATRFVDILVRKFESAYGIFLQALEESFHSHIVDELEGGKKVTGSAAPVFQEGLSEQQKTIACDTLISFINNEEVMNEHLIKDGLLVRAERGSIKLQFTVLNERAIGLLEQATSDSQNWLTSLFADKLRPILIGNKIKAIFVKINSTDIQQCRQDFRNSNSMTDEHRNSLLSMIEHMTNKLKVTDDLMQLLTIDDVRKQTVSNTEFSKRPAVLLDIISRKPDKHFAEFLTALNQTNQTGLVRFFQPYSDCELPAASMFPALSVPESPDCSVALFIDNSNLFIEGKKFHAKRLRLLVDQDPCFRIDIGTLCQVLLDGRSKHTGKLYGSEPPALDTVWKKIREKGLNVVTYLRDTKDREKEVGSALSVDATEFVCQRMDKPGTIILVAGDRDYCPVVEKIMKYGWKVELAAFTKTINNKLIKLTETAGSKLVIKKLEDIAESNSSWFYVNRRFMLLKPNSRTPLFLPHSRTMVLEFSTPFNIEAKKRDVSDFADILTEITRVPCLFHVRCLSGSSNTNILYIIGITSTNRGTDCQPKRENEAQSPFMQEQTKEELGPAPRMDFFRIWRQHEGVIRDKCVKIFGELQRIINYIDYVQGFNMNNFQTPTANRFETLETNVDMDEVVVVEEDEIDDTSEIDWNCYYYDYEESDQGYDTLSEISDTSTDFEEKLRKQRSVWKTKKTSDDCEFSFCCMKGSRCPQQHSPEEKEFFKQNNGKGVTCYKSKPCSHFDRFSCNKGIKSLAPMCPYYHSSQEARCYLCKRNGGELGHAIDERHENEPMAQQLEKAAKEKLTKLTKQQISSHAPQKKPTKRH